MQFKHWAMFFPHTQKTRLEMPAPYKVLVFSWWLLFDQLPTATQLQKRGIIIRNLPRSCSFCKDAVEDKNHMFLSCPFSSAIWNQVFRWLGIHTVLPRHIDHLYDQMGHSIGGATNKRIKLVFWHAACWLLRNARNSVIFNSEEPEPGGILMAIKSIAWQWIAYKKGFAVGYQFSSWFMNPLVCL